MLVLLVMRVIVVVAFAYRLAQIAGPTNVLIAHARAARPTCLLAAALAALAIVLVALAHGLAGATGTVGGLNFVVLVLVWDAIELTLMALSVVARTFGATMRRQGRDSAEGTRQTRFP